MNYSNISVVFNYDTACNSKGGKAEKTNRYIESNKCRLLIRKIMVLEQIYSDLLPFLL